jgi:transcription initiation factor IIE alpha subunit
MSLPCPSCRTPLGLDLAFILKHPISVCPGCGTIMNFTVNDDIKKKFKDALNEIENVKKQYKGTVKFGK